MYKKTSKSHRLVEKKHKSIFSKNIINIKCENYSNFHAHTQHESLNSLNTWIKKHRIAKDFSFFCLYQRIYKTVSAQTVPETWSLHNDFRVDAMPTGNHSCDLCDDDDCNCDCDCDYDKYSYLCFGCRIFYAYALHSRNSFSKRKIKSKQIKSNQCLNRWTNNWDFAMEIYHSGQILCENFNKIASRKYNSQYMHRM